MNHLFQLERYAEIKDRLFHLQPDATAAWGKMNVAQMLAHCSGSFEMAMGQICPKRILLGRMIGPMVKRAMKAEKEPMRRNSMTDKSVLIEDKRDFATEKQRLQETMDRFMAAGPAGCSKHPHFFFGPMTPEEWAMLMYQHMDHHLRQFRA